MVKKNLPSKKVGVFKESLGNAIVWLKPGDKLKYDTADTRYYYLDAMGEVPYRKVFYNGQVGYIVAEAIEYPKYFETLSKEVKELKRGK